MAPAAGNDLPRLTIAQQRRLRKPAGSGAKEQFTAGRALNGRARLRACAERAAAPAPECGVPLCCGGGSGVIGVRAGGLFPSCRRVEESARTGAHQVSRLGAVFAAGPQRATDQGTAQQTACVDSPVSYRDCAHALGHRRSPRRRSRDPAVPRLQGGPSDFSESPREWRPLPCSLLRLSRPGRGEDTCLVWPLDKFQRFNHGSIIPGPRRLIPTTTGRFTQVKTALKPKLKRPHFERPQSPAPCTLETDRSVRARSSNFGINCGLQTACFIGTNRPSSSVAVGWLWSSIPPTCAAVRRCLLLLLCICSCSACSAPALATHTPDTGSSKPSFTAPTPW
ncbi:PREDICTED: uncharacterized protein LOC106147160 [Chinchilla lanigera]|uniref:uncharacterized protein LOC106147160 n=1 Tax=Chinchilla lanigera TaxID=34839 RepID=UPI00069762DC|nr:PREDICTED: uncharacterized protein LOC106147160 [Chinchilla lanigera]